MIGMMVKLQKQDLSCNKPDLSFKTLGLRDFSLDPEALKQPGNKSG